MLAGSSSVGVMPLGGAAQGEEGQKEAMDISETHHRNTKCPKVFTAHKEQSHQQKVGHWSQLSSLQMPLE